MPVVSLSQIHTLRQFYNNGVLTAAKPDKVRYKSAGNFLDRVSLYQGDICQLELDAIVNAANRSLLGGGGVDGAIHKAAGPELVEECETLNGCQTGDAKITKGYNLPSKHVIHAVGPIYSTRLVDEVTPQLASCYKRSLQIAVENELKHVAFPSISTGIYGYPIEDATHVALEEARRFLETSEGEALDRVLFVVWSDTDKSVYESLIPLYFPPEERRS